MRHHSVKGNVTSCLYYELSVASPPPAVLSQSFSVRMGPNVGVPSQVLTANCFLALTYREKALEIGPQKWKCYRLDEKGSTFILGNLDICASLRHGYFCTYFWDKRLNTLLK